MGPLSEHNGDVSLEETRDDEKQGAHCVGRQSTLLFIDVETTGFPGDWDVSPQQFEEWPHIVQLAWLVAMPSREYVKSEDIIIKPDGYEVPAASLKYHGITTETAEVAGIALEEALQRLASDLEWYDPVVVAHNLEFDSKVVDAAFYRIGREGPIAGRDGICTMRASADYCDLPGGKWPKLEELYAELFGEPLHGAHNALYDVMATARCYFEFRERSAVASSHGEADRDQRDIKGASDPSVGSDHSRMRQSTVHPQRLYITNVGHPDNPKQKANGKFDAGVSNDVRWFQVEVNMLRRGRKVTSRRNFIDGTNDSLDLEWAMSAAESGENLAEGEGAWRIETVDIEPLYSVIDGEERTQTTARIIVLPGESVEAALKATNRNYRLRTIPLSEWEERMGRVAP